MSNIPIFLLSLVIGCLLMYAGILMGVDAVSHSSCVGLFGTSDTAHPGWRCIYATLQMCGACFVFATGAAALVPASWCVQAWTEAKYS